MKPAEVHLTQGRRLLFGREIAVLTGRFGSAVMCRE
jgi:hypothetical protein